MSRRIAREMALQTLFQLDFADVDRESALATVCVERGIEPGTGSAAEKYALELIAGVTEQKTPIDAQIATYAIDWSVDRMAGVDRNILRIAVYEMLYAKELIVPNIAIDEAVELAKIFGSDETPRFINGILGNLARAQRAEA